MTTYQLNMARGFVMPLESRKKWLHWFFAYLVLTCLVIVWVLYDVIQRVNLAQTQRDALRQQEERFLAGHPEHKTIPECNKALNAMVAVALRDVKAVAAFEAGEFNVAGVLLGLAEPLPQGLTVGSFDYDSDSRKVGFEIVMPASLKLDDKVSPPQLIAMWEKEPLLAGHLVQIENENSERVKRNGTEILSWRFSAVAGGQ